MRSTSHCSRAFLCSRHQMRKKAHTHTHSRRAHTFHSHPHCCKPSHSIGILSFSHSLSSALMRYIFFSFSFSFTSLSVPIQHNRTFASQYTAIMEDKINEEKRIKCSAHTHSHTQSHTDRLTHPLLVSAHNHPVQLHCGAYASSALSKRIKQKTNSPFFSHFGHCSATRRIDKNVFVVLVLLPTERRLEITNFSVFREKKIKKND